MKGVPDLTKHFEDIEKMLEQPDVEFMLRVRDLKNSDPDTSQWSTALVATFIRVWEEARDYVCN